MLRDILGKFSFVIMKMYAVYSVELPHSIILMNTLII